MEIFNKECGCKKAQMPSMFQSNEAFMLGNLFENLYQSYKGFSNYCFQPTNQRQQLLLEVQINRSQMAKKNYEMNFGPLSVSDSNTQKPFQWILSPWPWQHQN